MKWYKFSEDILQWVLESLSIRKQSVTTVSCFRRPSKSGFESCSSYYINDIFAGLACSTTTATDDAILQKWKMSLNSKKCSLTTSGNSNG